MTGATARQRTAKAVLGAIGVMVLVASTTAPRPLAAATGPRPHPAVTGSSGLLALAGRSAAHSNPSLEQPPDYRVAHVAVPGPIAVNGFNLSVSEAARLGARTAQQAPNIAGAAWSFVGPTNIGGRIVDVAPDPQTAGTVYAAAAGGGVWKSTDSGVTFAPAWPDDLTQAMGALAIGPTGVLYAGTGEANPGGGSITYGGTGIYRSRDGGASWQLVGLPNSYAFGRIATDPSDPAIVFAAAAGNLFVPGGDRGLYRSTDGGDTWQLVLAGDNTTTGAVDVVIDPSNHAHIWAAMWDHIRSPGLRVYGGAGSGLYQSFDDGTTWARIAAVSLADPTKVGRIGIAVAPSNSNDVYAILITWDGPLGGFFHSTDAGVTWAQSNDATLTSSQTSYGWWFGRLTVDPANPLRVFAGGVSQSVSTDGGSTWTNVSTGHADHHALVFDPTTPGRAYMGNDGGVEVSTNSGSSWTRATYQPYTQFYSVGVSQQDATRLVGGAQDNGALRSYSATSSGWNQYVGGDGTETVIDPALQEDVYGCSQYGSCSHFLDGGDGAGAPITGTTSSRHNWFTPIVLDPATPETTVYYAGNQLNRSTNGGLTWSVISPDITGSPVVTDPFYPNYGTITTVAAGPMASNLIIAGTDTGYVQYSHDGGTNWTRSLDPHLPAAYVTRVAVDQTNVNTDYVTFSAFRQGGHVPYVLRSSDGGVTWTDISGDLPQTSVNDILVIGSELVVATDVGVFLTVNGGTNWLRLGSGLPLAPIDAIQYQNTTNQLFAATFGRGMWVTTVPTPAQIVPEGPLVAMVAIVAAAAFGWVRRRRR